ncbi:D-2-hydroxyacid dehydrogenase [Roseovarius pelagicus]|uniref:D-2-hydroxyacid dehydrogenase n=1 Tax=Roseovarius pelagicus TaxID=2980108 RepID=A0ABY6D6S9_9RHOB|nr:D-2-hydroxyacid dehydrogenase [Roseovarius pelagicus]UXX81847.1 D-2-hydroxyacid dehydrogenase [Roseovarius pelagicus]
MTDTPRILIHNSTTATMAKRLAEAAPDTTVATCESYEALPAMISDFRPDIVYGICFAGRQGFPREAVTGPGGPKWIAVGGSGVDHLRSWDTNRVTVTNSSGVASAMMAEYVFGTILHFTLDIPGLAADQAACRWDGSRLMQPLAVKTMLIVGLGHTGQAVAARAKAFGMHVIGTRARPTDMENVDEVHPSDALLDLMPRADFVIVCVPLLPATRGLIGAQTFAAMKPSAILVDVSRGGVVDGDALVNAIRGGAIAAAALDVFEPEPLPADHPIWGLDNVIVSPHCSAVYEGWNEASFELFLKNLERWRKGETLHNMVSPERGY